MFTPEPGDATVDTISMVHDADSRMPRPRAACLVHALQAHRSTFVPERYFPEGDSVTVTRRRNKHDTPTATIATGDRWMSSPHFRLLGGGNQWTLADAGSKNGTFVNGAPAGRVDLDDGDVIEAGTSFFVFRSVGAPALDGVDRGDALGTLDPDLEHHLGALQRAAASPAPILLFGDTGTGKEVLARAIRGWADRRGPFVAVNCAAIPGELVQSELFGHRKGAFSGAVDDHPGLVRAAHDGILFLDEIGDLPLAAQGSLLRVLQEREVLPVGATSPIPVDLRIIAATHRSLAGMVESGEFRRDLFARLRGFQFHLPPLRARRQDLGVLARRILHRTAPGRRVRFTPGAARALFAHDWPLNIRELEQTLRHALALTDDGTIDRAHLPADLGRTSSTFRRSLPTHDPETLHRELVELCRIHQGNVSAVARHARMSRVQIHRWIKRLGIDVSRYRPG